MRVKAHAIIWIDGLLIVARQAGGGRQPELTLPGGHVNAHESIADALKREVSEETGLDVDPGPLLYVSEVNELGRTHDLELIFLAEASRVPMLRGRFTAIDLDSGPPPDIRPAILKHIAESLASPSSTVPCITGPRGVTAESRSSRRRGRAPRTARRRRP